MSARRTASRRRRMLPSSPAMPSTGHIPRMAFGCIIPGAFGPSNAERHYAIVTAGLFVLGCKRTMTVYTKGGLPYRRSISGTAASFRTLIRMACPTSPRRAPIHCGSLHRRCADQTVSPRCALTPQWPPKSSSPCGRCSPSSWRRKNRPH